MNQLANYVQSEVPSFIKAVVPQSPEHVYEDAREDKTEEVDDNVDKFEEAADQETLVVEREEEPVKTESNSEEVVSKDIPDEDESEEETVDETELSEICKSYAAQVAAGIPRGLRTLFSNFDDK